MSSTVRSAITENIPDMKHKSVTIPTYIKPSVRFDSERCSDQKRSFDLRRHLQMYDDSQRLHLEEIQSMMSPENGGSTVVKGLIPPLENQLITKSS